MAIKILQLILLTEYILNTECMSSKMTDITDVTETTTNFNTSNSPTPENNLMTKDTTISTSLTRETIEISTVKYSTTTDQILPSSTNTDQHATNIASSSNIAASPSTTASNSTELESIPNETTTSGSFGESSSTSTADSFDNSSNAQNNTITTPNIEINNTISNSSDASVRPDVTTDNSTSKEEYLATKTSIYDLSLVSTTVTRPYDSTDVVNTTDHLASTSSMNITTAEEGSTTITSTTTVSEEVFTSSTVELTSNNTLIAVTPTPSPQTINKGTIVAAVIAPFGTIIVCIIIFLLYKFRKSKRKEMDMSTLDDCTRQESEPLHYTKQKGKSKNKPSFEEIVDQENYVTSDDDPHSSIHFTSFVNPVAPAQANGNHNCQFVKFRETPQQERYFKTVSMKLEQLKHNEQFDAIDDDGIDLDIPDPTTNNVSNLNKDDTLPKACRNSSSADLKKEAEENSNELIKEKSINENKDLQNENREKENNLSEDNNVSHENLVTPKENLVTPHENIVAQIDPVNGNTDISKQDAPISGCNGADVSLKQSCSEKGTELTSDDKSIAKNTEKVEQTMETNSHPPKNDNEISSQENIPDVNKESLVKNEQSAVIEADVVKGNETCSDMTHNDAVSETVPRSFNDTNVHIEDEEGTKIISKRQTTGSLLTRL